MVETSLHIQNDHSRSRPSGRNDPTLDIVPNRYLKPKANAQQDRTSKLSLRFCAQRETRISDVLLLVYAGTITEPNA